MDELVNLPLPGEPPLFIHMFVPGKTSFPKKKKSSNAGGLCQLLSPTGYGLDDSSSSAQDSGSAGSSANSSDKSYKSALLKDDQDFQLAGPN